MSILSDLRFGTRMILKRPGTSSLAIIALALGIGLTTTMFSIVQGAILRGLPFPESERIMHLGRVTPQTGTGNPQSVPIHDYVDWRASQQSFEDLGAFAGRETTVSGGLAPDRYRGAAVTPNMLRILRVSPVQGRDFTDDDAKPGAPLVAIVSYRVWASQFELDPSIVGRVVRINGKPTSIIGVMPPKFGFPQAQDIWLPLTQNLPSKRGTGDSLQVFGRLKPGVSAERASGEMVAIAARLAAAYPENKDMSARVTPYIRRYVGNEAYTTLFTMLGAVLGVMLIACANVANLQLARAAERTREVAVRTALGAGRSRIIVQMLIEGLMLSTAGAIVGVALAIPATGFFNRAVVDSNPPFWIDIRIDTTVLLFASLLTIVATLAASLLPALRTTRQDVHAVLKDEGRANTGVTMGRFSRALVVVEVLVSCCLLIVSGLMIKSVVNVGSVVYPYPTDEIFAAPVAGMSSEKLPQPADRARFLERLETDLRGTAGVTELALVSAPPENAGTARFMLEGQSFAKPEEQPATRRLVTTTRLFEVLRVKLKRGRPFGPTDVLGSQPVVIVSEDFAQKYFPRGDALESRIRFGSNPADPLWTIVGIAPRLVSTSVGPNDTPETVYVPLQQAPSLGVVVLADTAGEPMSVVGPMRRTLMNLDEDVALTQPNTLAAVYARNRWVTRVFGTLFMTFGVAALLLAAAGLYGVMAFSVRRRTQEIGVRMALGAARSGVIRMILWQGMWRVLLGVGLGLAPAWWLGGAMRALLANVTRTDLMVYVVAVTSLLLAGFLASVIPALRAASIDPLKALRHD